MDRTKSAPRTFLICALLSAASVAAFWPVVHSDFLNFDDDVYVTENPWVNKGLTLDGFVWAMRSSHAGNWHPLTWLSHMLDVQMFGLKPAGHHLTNILFHCANTMLLWVVLRRMTGAVWRSAFVAALFALHPLHVESVAWVAERKDVLSAFFGLLSLWAYARHVQQSDKQNRSPRALPQGRALPVTFSRFGFLASGNYWLAFSFFALGLMSKPMLVTWPFLMLLLDYWPLKRFGLPLAAPQRAAFRRLLWEKLPFFALSLLSCVITLTTQQRAISSVLSLERRIQNVFASYAQYLKKMAWPTDLAAYYPYEKTIPPETTFISIFVVMALSLAAVVLIRKRPYITVGWLWYLGTLAPVVGFVQVGAQAMADRYTYVPLVGVFVAIAWSAEEITRAWRFNRAVLVVGSLAVLAACLTLTRLQVRFWKDNEALFRHAVAATRDNAVAHLNLGRTLAGQGKWDEAGEHFAEALRINPGFPLAQSNLGLLFASRGQLEEAIQLYRAALQTDPGMARTHYLLGSALDFKGRRDEAVAEHRAALVIDPNLRTALNDLAWILATDPDPTRRNGAEAVTLAERACRLTAYRDPLFIGTLAGAYAEAGRFEDAVKTGEKARELATAGGQKELAERNTKLIEDYRAHKPARESATVPSGPATRN